jgi:hypothetical protein
LSDGEIDGGAWWVIGHHGVGEVGEVGVVGVMLLLAVFKSRYPTIQ